MQFSIKHSLFHISLLTLIAFFAKTNNSEGNPIFFPSKPISNDTIASNVSLMFTVTYGKLNSFDLKTHPVFKNNGNEFLFFSSSELLDGFLLSDSGMLSWSPTTSQFNKLKDSPLLINFYAHTQSKSYIIGKIRVIGEGERINEPIIVNSESTQMGKEIIAVVSETDKDTTLIPISILLPSSKKWDTRNEGEAFSFKFGIIGGSGNHKFEVLEPGFLMEKLDEYGNFKWETNFDVAIAEEHIKSIPVKIRVFDTSEKDDIKTISLYVRHVNRPPVVNELPTFYIQYNAKNIYHLKKNGLVYDPDGDSIIFNPVLKELPQGMSMDKQGDIVWKPSRRQFNFLRNGPIFLSFILEDYPKGEKTIGQVKIEVSQADLPPQITMIPNKEKYELNENEELRLNLFISDPNGEDDMLSFGFVSENGEINDGALTQNKNGQYEFSWIPGYDFVEEEGGEIEFNINFFAIDKESNRTEKNIQVVVVDTENILEKDRILYDQYRTVLERSWDMIVQLKEKEDQFNKEYKEAKNGKKNRSIITAGLGGLTGLATIIEGNAQKWITGLGGTATATLGTLEASNVIGEPPSEVMLKLSYVSQKRNDLVVYGNVFASKYALPLSRRAGSFQSDLRSLSIHLNLKDISKLELDSTWENSKKSTDRNIKKEFKDFNPDTRFSKDYK